MTCFSNYGPSYAMLNCGTMGYTIETPYNNQASSKLFEYGMYGLVDYVMENKDDIYSNQLEFFRRGINNEDHREDMESWYVDISNKVLESGTWRPLRGQRQLLPEYYVPPWTPPLSGTSPMPTRWASSCFYNSVKVSKLNEDTKVGRRHLQGRQSDRGYVSGQAHYANAVLWEGAGRLRLRLPLTSTPSPSPTSPRCAALTASPSIPSALSPASWKNSLK